MAVTTSIKYLGNFVGEEVSLDGWVYNTRSSGKIGFILLRDGSGLAQAVIPQEQVSEEVFNAFDRLTNETSLTIKGRVSEDARAPGGYELLLSDLTVHHLAEPYPITPKSHGTAFLLDHRHLWLRSRRQHAAMLIRHEIIRAIRDFLDRNDFILIDTPIFTPNACEGTTTLFETEYFGQTAYLAQSGQLYNEAGIMAFKRVYCFGPTFRAEKSKTRRHLTEFWMVEPEMAYCDLDGNIAWAEQLVTYIVQRALENRQEQLAVLERDLEPLAAVKTPFPRIAYSEALELLRREGTDFTWGGDFGGHDETIISAQFDRPVVVHRFPAAIKAFYMKRDPDDDRLALGMDILAPEGYGEIIGGGQREEELAVIERRVEEEQLPEADFQWYLDLRRYGTVPHSGFGMGIERVVAWICGLAHLREAIAFPRTMNRLRP